MDDKKGRIKISRTTRLITCLVVATILTAASSLLIFSKGLAPEESRVVNQFNRLNASTRHLFKVSNLNYRALDAFLEAFITKDEERLSDSLDYLNASIGFIHVGYIENKDLVQQVVPRIKGSIALIEQQGLTLEVDKIRNVRDNFNATFHQLELIEKNIYVNVQQLFSHQQQLQKRWQIFYLLLIVSALLGLLAITFLSFKQNRLIHELESNQKSLVEEMKERQQVEEDKNRLTDELHQARKMESIGLMAGGVAHDLNNILSGIVGYPELLLKQLDQDSDMKRPLEAIHDSGVRASQVVDDLLTVSRGAATIKEIKNLNELVIEYFSSPEFANLQQTYPMVQFNYNLADEPLPILCSAVHVKKCIMNLVTNGTESIVGSGEVVVSTATATANSLDEKGMVLLKVDDTGSGISEDDVAHIFDPFYSKKHLGRSGTGLGLTIVWNTMDNHQGKAEVFSDSDGTRFTLSFPINLQENFETELSKPSISDFEGSGEHILVVDDEAQLRDICCRMLTDLGYLASSVSSGEEALSFLEHNKVDVVVLDMIMPPGINGRQTFEQICVRFPGQKAIITSGFSESEDVKTTLALGASFFIKKPYSTIDLGGALKKSLTD